MITTDEKIRLIEALCKTSNLQDRLGPLPVSEKASEKIIEIMESIKIDK